MPFLLAGLAVFFAIHFVPMVPDLRERFRQQLAAGPYLLVFSLGSIASLALIVYGYGQMHGRGIGNVQLWLPPTWTRHVVFLLMLPALILIVAAYVPSRVRTAVGHPMLASIKLWALGHLLVRGDLASVLLFGAFLAYAIVDRISVKRRQALGPLGAKTGGLSGDITVVAIAVGAYVLMLLWGHAWLIGVPLLSR